MLNLVASRNRIVQLVTSNFLILSKGIINLFVHVTCVHHVVSAIKLMLLTQYDFLQSLDRGGGME